VASHTSPLAAVHARLGATMTDFAGWSMPVRYDSELAEHQAVRTAAGIFDVSHMGQIYVTGPDAARALDHACVSALSRTAVGRAKYTMIAAADGGVLDDVIVYRTLDDTFLVIANAGNASLVLDELQGRCAPFDCEVAATFGESALIAVQGPGSLDIVAALAGVGADAVRSLSYYASAPVVLGETIPARVARTGYTGEDGYELIAAAADAEAVWAAATAIGGADLAPCGLAARDTLRLEAGMPLYGQELSAAWAPHQAGLGRVVHLVEGDGVSPRAFVGADALRRRGDEVSAWLADPIAAPDDARVLVGLEGDGRRAARTGYVVIDADGAEWGTVTSGALSPTLGFPVALAMLHPRAAAHGTEVFVDLRGTPTPMRVAPLPFYRRAQ